MADHTEQPDLLAALAAAVDRARADLGPVARYLTDPEPCPHTWIEDRPESDTWSCLSCGTEGNGTGPS